MEKQSQKLPFERLPPAEQIALLMRRIYQQGLTTSSGGNLSLLADDGGMWISPSALDKGVLAPAEVVRVGADGAFPTGSPRPSLEYPFHRAIYAARPDLRAIVHAHPADLLAFSIAHKVPDIAISPQAMETCGAVGYAEYAIPGSAELGENIAGRFAAGFDCVLLENHGAVCGGTSLLQAFHRFEALDFCARLHIQALRLGGRQVLSADELKTAQSPTEQLREFTPTAQSARETLLRGQICAMVHRACQQQLMSSSAGTLSARLDNTSLLISAADVDRQLLTPGDVVLIKESWREAGKLPSRDLSLHQRIYAAHSEISAIITAQPTHVMAFAVTGAHLDTHIIPESYMLLHDLPALPFAARNDHQKISEMLGTSCPAVMIEHEAVIATGCTILQAFDRLEVAEFTARSLIAAKILGGAVAISDQHAAELREAFF